MIPRKPTAHQLSAKTSLMASQRALVAATLIFPDAVLAAMGEPPSIARLIRTARQNPA
jgi:hypothetical protein